MVKNCRDCISHDGGASNTFRLFLELGPYSKAILELSDCSFVRRGKGVPWRTRNRLII